MNVWIMINERINRLREKMKANGISVCMIPTSDCHNSEYLSDYYKLREFFSGFTGSAGTLVIDEEEAALFTDGRYFIQAENELKGSSIKLMKMGEAGVPKLNQYLISKVNSDDKIGIDGKVITANFGEMLKRELENKASDMDENFDPAESIWKDRSERIFNKIFSLDDTYTGKNTIDKIADVRKAMKAENANVHILSSLDDIAYILNLRGNDIEYCPLFFSYMIIEESDIYLYLDKNAIDDEIHKYLSDTNVTILDYDDFYEDLDKRVKKWTEHRVLIDLSSVNYKIYSVLKTNNIALVDKVNPSTTMKCIKNETEIANIVKANIFDGIAMLRFEIWLKNELNKGQSISELDVMDKLLELRGMNDSFIEPSFETIAGFGEHGAIVHYSADEESSAYFNMNSDSLLLVDSGGHYFEGTTDVTRTYGIGNIEPIMKHHYTIVLKAMLKLMNHKFLYGARGANLDSIVRDLFWEEGLDFKHGTGHGIGYLLNVHELPVRIGWGIPEGKVVSPVFTAGMLTSDEPGLYIKGSHGIRIETDLVCRELYTNEFGRFLGFMPVTFVPVDLECINVDELTAKDREYLNEYHRLVREKLSPYLEGEELDYLNKVTEEI